MVELDREGFTKEIMTMIRASNRKSKFELSKERYYSKGLSDASKLLDKHTKEPEPDKEKEVKECKHELKLMCHKCGHIPGHFDVEMYYEDIPQ